MSCHSQPQARPAKAGRLDLKVIRERKGILEVPARRAIREPKERQVAQGRKETLGLRVMTEGQAHRAIKVPRVRFPGHRETMAVQGHKVIRVATALREIKGIQEEVGHKERRAKAAPKAIRGIVVLKGMAVQQAPKAIRAMTVTKAPRVHKGNPAARPALRAIKEPKARKGAMALRVTRAKRVQFPARKVMPVAMVRKEIKETLALVGHKATRETPARAVLRAIKVARAMMARKGRKGMMEARGHRVRKARRAIPLPAVTTPSSMGLSTPTRWRTP